MVVIRLIIMMLVIVIRLRLVVVVFPLDRTTYVGFFIWVFSLPDTLPKRYIAVPVLKLNC